MYPPVLPRKSIIYRSAPSFRNLAKAFINSLYVLRPNLLIFRYPVLSFILNDTSTLLTGMSPRVMVKLSSFFADERFIPKSTLESFRPLNFFITLSIGSTLLPTKTVSLIVTIRSPGRIPAFSDGPPGITLTTVIVSFNILNCMPIPLKLPSSSSFTLSRSLAGIYAEWGSNSPIILGIAFSTSLLIFTVSTY